ncbi:unnamed protein product [Amoebophrya sp. A120]|nr:unnamed protein product [Amoebophrya sp. A120]|eukprot:GSA120T00003768001.1
MHVMAKQDPKSCFFKTHAIVIRDFPTFRLSFLGVRGGAVGHSDQVQNHHRKKEEQCSACAVASLQLSTLLHSEIEGNSVV